MWFGKKKEPVASDMVWLTQAAKLRGLQNELCQASGAGTSCLVLAHFPYTLTVVQNVLAASAVNYELLEFQLYPASFIAHVARQAEAKLYLALSANLSFTEAKSDPPRTPPAVKFIVAERYPLEARDRLILEFAQACGLTEPIRFHASLEDALFQRFSGEQVLALARRLSPDEDTPIEAATLTTSIRAAQQKLKKEARGDMSTHSAEEWFSYNLRPS